MHNNFQFGLRRCFIAILVLGTILGVAVPVFRWERQKARTLNAVKVEGMSVVNALESYYKVHGDYPFELETVINSPMTPLGQFNYQVYDANMCYELRIYLPQQNSYLRWSNEWPSWVMGGSSFD